MSPASAAAPDRPTLTLEIGNRLEWAPRCADLLASLVAPGLPPERVEDVRLGLLELLVNAIEHGNLGVGAVEKRALLSGGRVALAGFYARRLADPAVAARRVRVECRLTAAECVWRIVDEGGGFDHRAYRSEEPGDPNLVAGRGILLARHAFDALHWEDGGRAAVATLLLVD